MKIQCETCGTLHELDPPSWVVSAGRAFRFRCSACGRSQSVRPEVEPTGGDGPPQPEFIDPQPAPRPEGPSGEPDSDAAVFLKQNGQIYMVRDWDTLKRWIVERRVDQSDLVSEGGIRWEPIGDRPDLAGLFAAPQISEVDATTVADVPFPFERIQPPASGGSDWYDDGSDGVPTGLPPLPTDSILPVTDRTPRHEAQPPTNPGDPDTEATVIPGATLALVPDIEEEEEDRDAEAPTAIGVPPTEDDAVVEDFDAAPTEVDAPVPDDASLPGAEEEATELMPQGSVPEAQVMVSETPAPAQAVERSGGWEDLLTPTEEDKSWDSSGEKAALLAMTEDAVPSVYREESDPAGMPVFTFDEDWDEYELVPTRGGSGLWLTAVAVTGIGIGVLGLVLFGPPELSLDSLIAAVSGAQADTIEAPEGERLEEDPLPAPATPPPAPVEAPVPPPDPVVEAPEPPSPVPPSPRPAPPKPSAAAATQEGWAQIDTNPSAARRAFREALDMEPNNAEANYGYGYALLLQSHPDAVHYLCSARNAADDDVRQDVIGLISSHSLSCP